MPFSTLGLHDRLLRGVRELGFQRPTPIQQDALPPALAGRDVLASAVTGSGKTAAFALPILQRLAERPGGTTRALVLTPTRELAAQIGDHLRAIGRYTRVTTTSVFGGTSLGAQERAFRRGVDVVVATPGRLLDHMRMPYARLQGLEILVIDEADRMLDMGFLPDIRRILERLPPARQTLLYSATLPPPIVALSRTFLRDPAMISVTRPQATATGLRQAAYPVPAGLKSALLAELVRRGEVRSVIAFTRTKHRANRLADFLLRNGIAAGRIHGNRSQAQRTQALSGFKAGSFKVLVATDIAARGIDVHALSHVVSFDVPASPADYVHRVGRTARAAATGDALLFVSPEEETDVRGIESALGQRLPRRTLDGFDYAAASARGLELRPRWQARPPRAVRPRASRTAARGAARGPARHRRRAAAASVGR
jgi:ATP-dependent RNA helicase RhlE